MQSKNEVDNIIYYTFYMSTLNVNMQEKTRNLLFSRLINAGFLFFYLNDITRQVKKIF